MADLSRIGGRSPVAPRNCPRIKQATRYRLHMLRRAMLLSPNGARIHFGIGTYDSLCNRYIDVFHSTPESGEYLVEYRTFQGNCLVEQVLVNPVAGVWERLATCKANPQPWTVTHNCQHTANWIFFCVEDSPTLDAVIIGGVAAVGAIAILAARR